MKANVFDIETLLITEVSIHKIVEIQNTKFGIIEHDGIFNAIYLKSGVIIDGTTSLTANSCVVYLYRALSCTNSLSHVINELKISNWCEIHLIAYPVNDLSRFSGLVGLEVRST